ncbi:MAG: hypothetical protein GX493_11985 [Firmicutes bacterium]|nr:hypothetical protein [Bacillota bacterium]
MGETRAIRGGKLLSNEEFRAHLALATRLENVGVLLGAGASISAGGKILQGVWEDFGNTYPDNAAWLTEEGFSPDGNLEKLLDRIQTAEQEWERQNAKGRNLKKLRHCRNNLYRSLIRTALLELKCWENPSYISRYPGLALHKQLLSRLVIGRRPGQPEPWLFTTNYDLALEWAADSIGLHVLNGFAGLHHRTFIPSNFELGFRNTQARGEARFGTYHIYLAKLHGSLSWIVGEDYVQEMTCKAIYPAIRAFLLEEKVEFPGLLIYPGASKYIHTSSFIYGELLRRFSEFLARPQTCLLVNGYSFGDEHSNLILASALNNPTLNLVLYVPEIADAELERIAMDKARVIRCRFLDRLLELKSPQVTIVGGGHKAYFDQFVSDLPEPILLDDHAERVQRLLKLFERMSEEIETEAVIAAAKEGEES